MTTKQTFTVGIETPAALKEMFLRRTIRAATRDEIERIADDEIARPTVEAVHVTPPTAPDGPWTGEVYAHIRGAIPLSAVLVTRAFIESLLA